MAQSKVVSVEDPDPHTAELGLSTLVEKSPVLSTKHSTEHVSSRVLPQTPEDDIASEARDYVSLLPENWPHLSHLFQRFSWDYTTAVSPSINKAVAHLHLLKDILDKFCTVESELATKLHTVSHETSAPRKSSITVVTSSKKALHFQQDLALGGSCTASTQSASSHQLATGSSVSAGTGLQIIGQGAKTDGDETIGEISEAGPAVSPDAPYLGIEDVTEEVILLLARLESDRQETMKQLYSERDRVKMLKHKINFLAEQKLVQLPVAVQKEHEACANDLIELNWHVNNRGRIESRIKKRVENAEDLNTRLKEDIGFVTIHIPLVQEKLNLEQEAMARIQQAQADANDELSITQERCDAVVAKYDDACIKASQERDCITADLDTVNRDLAAINEELSLAKKTHALYVEEYDQLAKGLNDNNQELVFLEVKCENLRVAEAMVSATVKDLEGKIKKEEYEQGKLQRENSRLGEKLMKEVKAYEQIKKDLTEAIELKRVKQKRYSRSNKELQMDIEDAGDKIRQCERQEAADKRNVDRMKKELVRTNNLIQVTNEDLASVTIVNNATKDQLQAREEKSLETEEALKATVEAMRKQMKEEMHSKTVMSVRINSDSAEFEKLRKESISKKQKMDRQATEVRDALDKVQAKLTQLKDLFSEKNKRCSDLKLQIDKMEREKQELREELERKRIEIEPDMDSCQDESDGSGSIGEELLSVNKRLDYMAWKTELMNNKLDDMDSSATMFSKAQDNTLHSITKLEEELEEVQSRVKAAEHIEDDLTVHLNRLMGRVKDKNKNHEDLLKTRNKVLDTLQNDFKSELVRNTELASTYRRLQNEHMFIKSRMLDKYDERVKIENAMKDAHQLSALQKKMQHARLLYFKYRHLYNDSECENLEAVSCLNGIKVNHLQTEMDNALEKISDFLQYQLNPESIHKAAMDNVEKKADRAQLSKKFVAPQVPVSKVTPVGQSHQSVAAH